MFKHIAYYILRKELSVLKQVLHSVLDDVHEEDCVPTSIYKFDDGTYCEFYGFAESYYGKEMFLVKVGDSLIALTEKQFNKLEYVHDRYI